LSRLKTLRKLESILENFLTRVVETEQGRMTTLKSVDLLDEIARDSLKGRIVSNRLGDWFANNRNMVETKKFDLSSLESIGNMLSEIRPGLDPGDPVSRKLSDQIDSWREKGVIPRRKLILKMKPKVSDDNLLARFTDYLGREAKLLESGEYEGRHLLQILDDILKSAAAKEDRMFLHLAGAMIYYLKMYGYKVSPFARRLKEIEKEKSGDCRAE